MKMNGKRVILFLSLMFMTVKYGQEFLGVRWVTLFVSLVMVLIYLRSNSNILLFNKYSLLYVVGWILILPIISGVRKGNISIYEIYLPITILVGIIAIEYGINICKLNLNEIVKILLGSQLLVAILSYSTIEMQWYGGYAIESFSDFNTFFALQLSVIFPFISGRYRNYIRLFFLITIYMLFSRLSFFLTVFILMVQLYKEKKSLFYGYIAALFFASQALALTDSGALMIEKMSKTLNIFNQENSVQGLDRSDIGRYAFIATTLDDIDSAAKWTFGNGLKKNVEVISSKLDISLWEGITDEMTNATVHNVYLEILSDLGVVGIFLFLCPFFYCIKKIIVNDGIFSPWFLSILIFSISYLFEPNYVNFFFQFMVLIYLRYAFEIGSRSRCVQ